MADKDLKYRIDADDRPLGSALSRVGLQLGQFNRGIDNMMTGVSGQLGRVTNIIGALAAMVAVGVVGIRKAIDVQDQMHESAQRLGMSTEIFSEYAHAAKLSGLETQDLSKAVAKLTGVLSDAQQGQRAAVDLFQRLKLDPKGIQDTDQLLQALADRFSQMPEGVARTSLAIDVFGEKLGPKMVPLLAEGTAGLAAMREEARQLGVVVSTETGAAAAQFNDNLDRLASAGSGAFQQLSAVALPTLNALSDGLLEAYKGGSLLNAAGVGLRTTFQVAAVTGSNLAFVLSQLAGDAKAVAMQFKVLWEEGIDGWKRYGATVREESQRARAELDRFQWSIMNPEAYSAGVAMGRDTKELARRGRKVPAYGGVPGFVPDDKPPTPVKGAGAEAKLPESEMQNYLGELQLLKIRYATENELREMSKAQEAAYWRELLASQQVTARDRIEITRRVASLELAELRDQAQQRLQLDQITRDRGEAQALAAVDQAQVASRSAFDQQLITQAELLQAEQQHEEQRLAIRRTYLQARLALLDPDRDPIAYQQILAQIEALEQQHTTRLAQLRAQGIGVQRQETNGLLTLFDTTLQSITQQIMSRTLTWRGLFNQVLGSIAQGALKTIGSIATNWIKGLLQMQTAEKGMTLASIHANAMKAGAAAFQAVVGIPIVGPALAPAAAAAAYAGTMAFASAEGGYDIPAGVNPLTQLHEREMVLPQEQADAVRAMAAGGREGGGLVIQGMPMPGGFFAVHQDEFVRFYERLKRNRYI